jgi:hypothetical protein
MKYKSWNKLALLFGLIAALLVAPAIAMADGSYSVVRKQSGDPDQFLQGGYFDTMYVGDNGLKAKRKVVTTTSAGTVYLTEEDSGTEYYNASFGTVIYQLPADPEGCEFTFTVGVGSTTKVEPSTTDQIVGKTNASGDYYMSSTAYSTLKIKGVSASTIAAESEYGTWTQE